MLAGHGAALCWADQHGRPVTPLWRTAGWGYLRFHQGAAHPWPRYGPRALRSWLDRLAATWPDEATVYAYFNNDPGGAAVADSAAFAAACRRAGRTVTRTPGRRPRQPGEERPGEDARPGAPAYLFTGKPRLTPPWLGSSQREVTALPRV